jgi:PAS domain S-box-containing protein
VKALPFTQTFPFARYGEYAASTGLRMKGEKTRPSRSHTHSKDASRPLTASQRNELGTFAKTLELVPAFLCKLDGEILAWGRAIEGIYGWTRGQAAGRSVHDLLATEFPLPLAEIEAELLGKGVWQGELARAHRDGRRLKVASRWTLYRHGRKSQPLILEFDSDITWARDGQALLEEREARLRSVLETAPDPIITIDERGIIQSFSRSGESVFGYAAEELIGRSVSLLMPAQHRDKHDGYIERYLETGEKRIIGIGRQVEAQRKDGTIIPIELAVGEVKIGGTRTFTGFVRDLTGRVKMEQELRQAQKMEAIGQLTAGVAHDFNNLLTVISGNLEMLERRLKDPGDRGILNEAQEASKLGAELTGRLLAFGRRQPLNPKVTDLNALTGDMAELLKRSLGESVETEIRLAPNLPLVLVDPGQIANALLNLAINARDAMLEGGRLVIETGRIAIGAEDAAAYAELAPGSYVTLAVTDTGTGMTPEVRQRAFEPFYTTKGPGAGSGLGLSMVYGFVKQSGGHVTIYSEIGLGTTVRLYLPEHGGESQSAREKTAIPRHRLPAGKVILVVEDNERVRDVSVRHLKELGFVVIEAGNGSAALTIIERGEPIDLLFTDVVMPGGMSGIELAHEAQLRRPGLKVLFTSGYAEPAALKGGLLTANVDWLAKPYSISGLEAKLNGLIAR